MGDIALVTGANTGIGFEAVRGLAERGMTVYLGSRDPAKGAAAAAALSEAGDVRPVRIEMTDERSFGPVLDAIERAHGRLDILVNNAGVSPRGGALTDDPATIRETFEVNLHGPARLTQLAVPLLRKAALGRVVNVTSRAGAFPFMVHEATPDVTYSYCTSKAAMNAATILFAKALAADGIKVNACNPGYVKTEVTRFKGTRTPEEGARIILHLATLGPDGPTGGFFDEKGSLDW